MRTLSRLVMVLAVLGLVLARSAPADAQDARERFLRGQAAYSQGDYEAAVEAWQEAYSLDPRPLLLFNLAQAHERLGRLQEARDDLDRYLAEAPADDEHLADARARLAAIRERLARTAVVLEGGPEGATILIDGTDRGRTPHPDPILLDPGEHEVVVQLGGERFTTAVVVPAGQSLTVHVRMGSSGGGEALPVGAIVVFSIAGVTLVSGVVLGALALTTIDQASAPDDSNATTAHGLAIGADVSLAVSLAAAVGGTVLAIVETSGGGGEQASLRVLPYAAPGSAGAAVFGRF